MTLVEQRDEVVPLIDACDVSPITRSRGEMTSRCDHIEARLPPPRGCDQVRA
jgi:hypothetical protein